MEIIEKSAQRKILKAINGLPPLAWLNLCKSEDQIEHWRLSREAFQVTYLALKEYFEGKKSTLNSELAEAQRDYYLAIYSLIQQGWKYIESAAQEAAIRNFPSTPGEAIIKIIECDCAAFFAPCLEPYEWSKDSAYRLYLLGKEVQKLEESSEKFTKKEELKVKKFATKLKQMQRPYSELLSLRHFCLAICDGAVKGDHTLKRKLEAFNNQQLYLHKLIAPKLRQAVSYRWDDEGDRRVGTRAGGVYN